MYNAAKSGVDRDKKNQVLTKCWAFLYQDFHKFSQANQIKIALALCQKTIPQQVEGMDMKQIVVMGEIKRGGDPLRFNIGDKIEDDSRPANAT